ncbi:dual specificity protein phosphatase 13-like isoform X1 [Polyodon spathula]|uniref:dual specificity protein phosphatase 13-like isoform X1 n=2 Tax=Polyodon spathula TaxID=7913 RepID=UPI001B7EC73F|nr:dual specificity protein phosphatase 13-like isoform X1 [Polyodon spathula]
MLIRTSRDFEIKYIFNESTDFKAHSRRMPVTNNTVSSAIKSQSEYITPSLQDLQHLLWTRRGASGHVDQVWPRIYLGDKWTAKDKRSLQSLKITHILNAADGKYNVCTGARYYSDMNILYHGVEAFDTTAFDISPFFYSAAKFIRKALDTPGDGKVLVHCAMGLSRSATLVLAFLMIYENKTLVDAVKAVSEHRNISPNMGFLGQLRELDMRLNDERKLRRDCNV